MLRRSILTLTLLTLAACASAPALQPVAPLPAPTQPRLGLALGGGAAKGFAHIGVIKMLEAQGFKISTVAGTSAGSVVGALYASGMDAYALQENAFALDETAIRDLSLGNGGLVKGEKLQNYVNELVRNRTMEKLGKPFAAVATELDTGRRAVFTRGNTGQGVRASCSIPGVFQPVIISGKRFVDGGVVSPVPVDAARELGADLVIAVDISSKAQSGKPVQGIGGILNQTITIMGQKLGEQELSRAEVVISPRVGKIGAADFELKHTALLEGERAAQAAIPSIRAAIQKWQTARQK